MFMKNLKEDLSKSGKKAAANMSLEMFNKVYDDTTLFHYFADDSEMLQWVFDTYNDLKAKGKMTAIANRMPLLALNQDKKNMTSIDWALHKQK